MKSKNASGAGATKDRQQKKAWGDFLKQFSNEDKSKLVGDVFIGDKYNVSVEMFFKEGPGSLLSVFRSDRKYCSQRMKTALGVILAGFLYQLSPRQTKTALPIPAVNLTEVAPCLKRMFNNHLNIYVTADTFFATKFRKIFQKTKVRNNSAAESKQWLGGPKIKYWPLA